MSNQLNGAHAQLGPPEFNLKKSVRVPQAKREESRAALISAATELIAAKGLEGWTLADVATKARRSHGLAGHHFGTKANLVRVVGEMLLQLPPPGVGARAGREALLQRLQDALTATARNETKARARAVVLNQSHRVRYLEAEIDRYYASRAAAIRADLTQAIADEGVPEMDAASAAWSILAMYRGVELLVLQCPADCDRDRMVETFLEQVALGLRRWSRPEPNSS